MDCKTCTHYDQTGECMYYEINADTARVYCEDEHYTEAATVYICEAAGEYEDCARCRHATKHIEHESCNSCIEYDEHDQELRPKCKQVEDY